MKPVRKMAGDISPGDLLQLAGSTYWVRTAKSDRNKWRHITATNEETGANARIRLHPHQDFYVTQPSHEE